MKRASSVLLVILGLLVLAPGTALARKKKPKLNVPPYIEAVAAANHCGEAWVKQFDLHSPIVWGNVQLQTWLADAIRVAGGPGNNLDVREAVDVRDGSRKKLVFIIEQEPPIVPCEMWRGEPDSPALKKARLYIKVIVAPRPNGNPYGHAERTTEEVVYQSLDKNGNPAYFSSGIVISAGWTNGRLGIHERLFDGREAIRWIYPPAEK